MCQSSSVTLPRTYFIYNSLFPAHIVRGYFFSGTKENLAKQSHTRKARLRASVTQRRIQDLSVNMRMKEELIKELDKTGGSIEKRHCVCLFRDSNREKDQLWFC